MSVVGGVKGTKMRLSLEVPPPIFNVYRRRRFVCVRWGGGAQREFKTAALVLKCTSSYSFTCINVIFVGVGKMNVNPRFSLQVPPPIC